MPEQLKFKNITHIKYFNYIRRLSNLNIGLFFGSFNPPHDGHIHIAKEAIKRLNLNILIWAVTPKSPLKSHKVYMHDYNSRISLSKKITQSINKIKVIPLETSMYNNYTVYVLDILNFLAVNNCCFWILGDDIIEHLDQFKNWQKIIKNNNLAVFTRHSPPFKTLSTKPGMFIRRNNPYNIYNIYPNLQDLSALFFMIPRNTLSSTKIRQNMK